MFVSPPIMLITDDDGAFRETLRSAFAPHGFHTLTAGDGDEALEIVRRESVHLLLTDMHMPRMSGLEIIRQIRRSRLVIPCILISGGVDDGLVEEARDVERVFHSPQAGSFSRRHECRSTGNGSDLWLDDGGQGSRRLS